MDNQINETLLKPEKEFEARNNKEYEVKVIINSMVYGHKIENYLPGLYYLVLWKGYSEKKIPESVYW